MLFNIEEDHGDRLVGYLVPDGFSEAPRIRIVSRGHTLYEGVVTGRRESLVAAGRHATGFCGFDIGPELAPGLAACSDLQVRDAATGILIYRRALPDAIPKKVLRLETHLFPCWKLDDALGYCFQYYERGIDRHGRETATQMFMLNSANSVYLSGRLMFQNFSYWIEDGFDVVTCLQDPYIELAERLLVLGILGEDHAPDFLGERDAARFAPAAKYARTLDINGAGLNRALRAIEPDVEDLLIDPLVRQLTTSTPDETPGRDSAATALEILSRCKIIGFRDRPEDFSAALSEWLEIKNDALPLTPQFPRILDFAEKIKSSRALDHLLQRDLHVVDQAYAAANLISNDN